MKIVRFSSEFTGPESVGILTDEGVFNLSAGLQAKQLLDSGVCSCPLRSPVALMEAGLWDSQLFAITVEEARRHGLVDKLTLSEYTLLSPIPRPPKILALGRNYLAHAKELGHPVPTEPVFFSKLSSSVIGPDEPVVYMPGLTRVDHEVELAVVIGREGKNIRESDALDYVAGYTIVNDVTARDMQKEDLSASNPWTRSKGIDTFCPMGPCITLKDEIPEPSGLQLEMRVNGEVRQRDSTGSMLFSVPRVISYISRFVTLSVGDVIPTGTPEGISPVHPGDVMECYVERIGVLRNPVVADSTDTA